MKRNYRESGFTLLEILIASGIVAVVMLIVGSYGLQTSAVNSSVSLQIGLANIKQRVLDHISCPKTIAQCSAVVLGGAPTYVNVYNQYGGTVLSSNISNPTRFFGSAGAGMGDWRVLAYCDGNATERWVSFEVRYANLMPTNYTSRKIGIFSSLNSDKSSLSLKGSDFIPSGLEVCRIDLNRIATGAHLKCPPNLVLKGMNGAGMPICQKFRAPMFEIDNAGSNSWSCCAGSILTELNPSGGNNPTQVCRRIPSSIAACSDCPLNQNHYRWEPFGGMNSCQYRKLFTCPNPNGTGCPVGTVGCPRCYKNDNKLYVISTWPSNQSPSCDYDNIVNYWNPLMTVYQPCAVVLSSNPLTQNVVQEGFDNNGNKVCTCNGANTPRCPPN